MAPLDPVHPPMVRTWPGAVWAPESFIAETLNFVDQQKSAQGKPGLLLINKSLVRSRKERERAPPKKLLINKISGFTCAKLC